MVPSRPRHLSTPTGTCAFGNQPHCPRNTALCQQQHTTGILGSDTYVLQYDLEGRVVEVKKNDTLTLTFVYDGDGKQVKSTVNGVTSTIYIGNYYEKEGSTVRTYYYHLAAEKPRSFSHRRSQTRKVASIILGTREPHAHPAFEPHQL